MVRMARILDEDLQLVRDHARIDDVIGSYVTLRRQGADSSTAATSRCGSRPPVDGVRTLA